MLTLALPNTLEVLAPPYTLPWIVAPAILTLDVELLVASAPVVAAFPPPNTEHLLSIVQLDVPTSVVPPTVMVVFPNTVAVEPFPPAYALPCMLESFIYTVVFPETVPLFPPP